MGWGKVDLLLSVLFFCVTKAVITITTDMSFHVNNCNPPFVYPCV